MQLPKAVFSKQWNQPNNQSTIQPDPLRSGHYSEPKQRRKVKRHPRLAWVIAAAAVMTTGAIKLPSSLASGPNFSNCFLDRGDEGVLVAPNADFRAELERMQLVQARFTAKQENNDFGEQAASGETGDLEEALKKAKVGEDERIRIRDAHANARKALQGFVSELAAWSSRRPWIYDDSGGHRGETAEQRPRMPTIDTPKELPAEFADYFEGALAWHDPAQTDKRAAREAWERLLKRPAAERRWKSTWAAFMLGKLCETNEPDQAIAYFQKVRDLATHGFKDAVGLAAASLGLEARVRLGQHEYEKAIELYLEQFSSGDDSAYGSLLLTASRSLYAAPEQLRALARNPRTQRLITAYLISLTPRSFRTAPVEEDGAPAEDDGGGDRGRKWLEAVEEAGIKDVDSAEKLALVAYQNNKMEMAKCWLKRCASSPVAQWIEAKLLMREGKVDEAAAMLARCSKAFPMLRGTNDPPPADLVDTLRVSYGDPAGRQVMGELGVLELARQEYAQALDCLLNAGFWTDAAYVSERVLTIDELKSYVDRVWPRVSAEQVASEKEKYGDAPIAPWALREKIRYLLARRLTRSFKGDLARDYYPAEWVGEFDLLAYHLRIAWDRAVPPNDRAKAFFQAAIISRANGMELLGTEVGPDWHVFDGDFEGDLSWQHRSSNSFGAKILRARPEEIRRASEHTANPERRYHYRYQAALLGWEAAKLMPNESEETADVLCRTGSWLKTIDPDSADIVYKSLVRRNRKTALGAEADLRRWFPRLGDGPRVVPERPEEFMLVKDVEAGESGDGSIDDPAVATDHVVADPLDNAGDSGRRETAAAPEEVELPSTGRVADYVLEKGDSFASLALKLEVSVEELLELNQGVNPARLRIGQKIQVPVSSSLPSAFETGLGYTVHSGDTLWGVARSFSARGLPVSVDQILEANPGIAPTRIIAGQRILIPVE